MVFLRKILAGILILFFGLGILPSAGAQENEELLTLSSADRLMVISPHPDDDIIGAGGLIQEAVRLHIPVKVVYLTNGDSNSLAFMYYKKRPVLTRDQALKMGGVRQQEALGAAGHLGLQAGDLVFLGYPDFGMLNMFKKYWQSPRAYRSVLTKVDQVPYPSSMSYREPYMPIQVLDDFKKLLTDFKPTKVFVTHPADSNPDHQAAFLFMRIAIWDLPQGIDPPVLYTYLVHASGWPRPLGLHPELSLAPLEYLRTNFNRWLTLELNPGQIAKKEEAVGFHKTQIPYKPKYLFTFVRGNELFCEVKPLRLVKKDLDPKIWQEEEALQSSLVKEIRRKPSGRMVLKSVVYALSKGRLHVRIRMNQKLPRGARLDLYVFGYSQEKKFEIMPKLNIKIGHDAQAVVLDGKKHLRQTGVDVQKTGSDVRVSVPFSAMGVPQKILASVDLRLQNLPMESSNWQILEIEHDQ